MSRTGSFILYSFISYSHLLLPETSIYQYFHCVLHYHFLPTENIDTDMERKAICERETAAESAREGQDSPPPPPSSDTYITPFLPAKLFRLTRELCILFLREVICWRISAFVVLLSSKYKSSHDPTSNFE